MVTRGAWAILVTEMFSALVTFVIVPIIPFQVMRMGATPFQVSLLQPAMFVTQMISSAVSGPAAEWAGRRQVLLCAYVYQAIGVSVLGIAGSLPALFGALMVIGISAGCCAAMALAYLMEDAKSEAELSQVLTLHRLARCIGALGGPILGIMLKGHSLKFICRGLACLNAVNMLLGICCMTDLKPAKDGATSPSARSPSARSPSGQVTTVGTMVRELAQLLEDPGRVKLLGCSFWSSCIPAVFTGGSEAVFLRDRFGFNQQNMLMFFLVGTVSCIAGASIVQVLLHGIGEFHGFSAFFLAIAGTALGSLTALPFLLSTAAWLPYGYCILTTGLFNNMWTLGFLQLVNQRVPKSKIGSFIGLHSALGSAGSTLGPPIGGIMYATNGLLPVCFTCVAGAASAVIFGIWLHPTPPDDDQPVDDIDDVDPVVSRHSLPLLSRSIMSPALLVSDQSFVTRLLMQEHCFRFDPDIMEVYQTYREARDTQPGVTKNLSVHGDAPFAQGMHARRQAQEVLRRTQTAPVRCRTADSLLPYRPAG